MKKILYLFIIAQMAIFGTGCKKELDSEGVSRVTYYPILTVKGDIFTTLNKGASFTDPGFAAKVGTEDVSSKVVVEGSVNTSTPGVYVITYTSTNADGFSTSARRWVGVIDTDAQGADISGTYVRTNGVSTTVAKLGTGLYTIDNVGGVAGNASYIYPVYIFNTTGKTLVVPVQPNALGGDVYCTNISFTGTKIVWTVMGAGYGTSPRTFNKL